MKKEIEKEKKASLSKKDYEYICNFFEGNIKLIEIEDIYFDDMKRTLKKNNSILRLRTENKETFLNLKEKQKDGSSKETKIELKSKENFIKGKSKEELKELKIEIDIEEIASFKIKRKEVIYKNCKVHLDEVNLGNRFIYEIEIESDKLETSEKILLEILHKCDIQFKKSKPKIASFFEFKESESFLFSYDEFILVVEGKSDYNKIKKVYKDMNIFITNGLGMGEDKIEELRQITEKHNRKIVVLTDPDVPGEIIRNKINKNFNNVYNLYASKDIAKKKENIGIENLSERYIREIFSQKVYKKENQEEIYTMNDLIEIGIYNSKEKRMEFCKKHGISYGNNKKVLKQINDYQINPFC